MAKQYAPYVLKTVSDGFAAMLILFPFYFVTDSQPPILSLVCLFLLTGLMFGHYLGNPKFKSKKVLVVTVITICFGVGIIFSYSVYLIFASVLYLLRNGFRYSEEGTKPLNGSQALWVTLLAVALFIHAQIIEYSSYHLIFIVFMAFLLCFFSQMFIIGWFESNLKRNQKLSFFYLTGIAVVLAGTFSLITPIISPFLRQVMIWIILIPLWVLAWVFFPILNWIINLDIQMPDFERLSMTQTLLEQFRNEAAMSNEETTQIPTELIAFLIVCLVIVAIIFIVNRGRIVHLIRTKREAVEVTYGSLTTPSFFKKWKFTTPPNQVIRQQVWNLEKYAVTKGMERDWNETLSEWLNRLQIIHSDNEKYVDLYNSCRYGEKEISANNVKWFSQHSHFISGEIKKAAVERKKRERNKK